MASSQDVILSRPAKRFSVLVWEVRSLSVFVLESKTNAILYAAYSFIVHQLSVEWISHLLWFSSPRTVWLKNLAPFSHPIRRKAKTNRDFLAHIFPRLVPVSFISAGLWLVRRILRIVGLLWLVRVIISVWSLRHAISFPFFPTIV